MIAGSAPHVIGTFDIDPSEMMFIQYMPVWIPEPGLRIPAHVECFFPLIEAVMHRELRKLPTHYLYLTAKHLYVTPENMGNRPGWHSDGFGTDDVNYIWSDSAPTEFCIQAFDLSDDCDASIAQMETQAREENVTIYPAKSLLRLDPSVIHRVPINAAPGYRTFVKISVSESKYNLQGNAHNYLFDYDWEMQSREEKRNHPHKA
jgi:hypothetical protein